MSITPFFHVYHKYVFIMANISKIKISGTSYNLKDENACNVVELTQAQYDDLPTTAKTSNSLFVITDATAGDLSNYYTKSETDNAITAATSTKQDTLVSGTNIKTINGETLLGEGNIEIQGGGGKEIEAGTNISITTGETADTINCTLPIRTDGNYSGKGIILGKGINMAAKGAISIVGGSFVSASTNAHYSVGFGNFINLSNEAEFSCGEFSKTNRANSTFGDSGNTLFSVGNGTADNARHNAFEIRQNGDIYISKDGQDVKLQDQLGGGGSSYTAGDGIDINNDVISVTGKVDTSTYNTYTAATDTALASKQTTLTAGNGISIVDNVISATGGGGGLTEDDELLLSTALTDLNDRKIDASEVKYQLGNYQKKGDYATKDYVTTALEPYETKLDEINTEEVTAYALNDLNNKFGGLSLVKITESEYAALTTKNENTMYIVVADQS